MDKNHKLKDNFATLNGDMENKLFDHVYAGIVEISRKIPNILEMMSNKISKVQPHFDMLETNTSVNKRVMFKYGMLNCHLCLNAMTKDAHTEMDTSYTIISVPNQIDKNYRRLKTRFLFELNDNLTLKVRMLERMGFVYSGYIISHHQVNDQNYVKNTTFMNLASYGNKRLFHNMMMSFKRDLMC